MLYLDLQLPHKYKATTFSERRDLLLLLPERGIEGTLARLCLKSGQRANSIDIPFRYMQQDALLWTLEQALVERDRADVKRAQRVRTLAGERKHTTAIVAKASILTPKQKLFKAWMQYFRAVVMRTPTSEIAREIGVHYTTWQDWERMDVRRARVLPRREWFTLLWRWWRANIDEKVWHNNHKVKDVKWEEVTSPSEREKLKLLWRPHSRRFHNRRLLEI